MNAINIQLHQRYHPKERPPSPVTTKQLLSLIHLSLVVTGSVVFVGKFYTAGERTTRSQISILLNNIHYL